MKPWNAIVIGAGLNGLTAAASLADRTDRVLVVDQLPMVGGLVSRYKFHSDFEAPSILPSVGNVHPSVVSSLRLGSYGLEVLPSRSPMHILVGDGQKVTITSDIEETQASIAKISSKDAVGYGRYRALCDAVAPFLDKVLSQPSGFSFRDIPSISSGIRSLLFSKEVQALPRLAPLSANDFLDRFFETDAMKGALAIPALQATWGGPFDPFGALSIFLYEALSRFSVKGGYTALLKALHQSTLDRDVSFRMEAHVTEITFSQNGHANGIKLSSGEVIKGKRVIAACSPKSVLCNLVHHRYLGNELAWQARNLRSRGLTAHLAVALDRSLSELSPYARLAPGPEDLERAFDAAKHGSLPSNNAFEISCDPDSSVLSVLVHLMPSRLSDHRIPRVIEQLRPYIPCKILATKVFTPEDLETRYGMPGGHLYQLESAPDQLFLESLKSSVPGLTLCGSGMRHGGLASCLPGVGAAL